MKIVKPNDITHLSCQNHVPAHSPVVMEPSLHWQIDVPWIVRVHVASDGHGFGVQGSCTEIGLYGEFIRGIKVLSCHSIMTNKWHTLELKRSK